MASVGLGLSLVSGFWFLCVAADDGIQKCDELRLGQYPDLSVLSVGRWHPSSERLESVCVPESSGIVLLMNEILHIAL
ncbi:unnamed protein product [Ranitomeya imitator]|uniref:Secreted protein n=1 Tax=Ranitomeya imitator TaxID=111125 RepID=A0ABN9KV85_9NEOB|nr:unnamed protein product [Ranitomeya imitator]